MARREVFLGDSATVGFRAARKVGRRGFGGLVLALAVVGIGSLVVYSQSDGFARGTTFAAFWTVVAVAIVLARVVALGRSWRMWARAERGDATLTLDGGAVAKERRVSGYPMRTVVVRHDGVARYVHLLFPEEPVARRVPAGPVRLDLFGGSKVRGPARLTLPGGDVVWAFTSKPGRAVDLPTARARRDIGVGDSIALGGAWSGAESAFHPGFWDDDGPRTGGDGWSEVGDGWPEGSSWGSDSSWSGSGSGSDGGGSSGGWGGDGGGSSDSGSSGGSD